MKAKKLVDLFKKDLAHNSQETDRDINYTHVISSDDNKPKTLGRGLDCDVVTSGHKLAQTVSRHHAEIVYAKDGTVSIWDRSSRNKTYISRKKDPSDSKSKTEKFEVKDRTQLFDNDIIQLGPDYCLMILPYDEKAEKTADETSRKSDTETDFDV
jgi:pSer/pThr/pTyr-binding forkhead associated (FHA) protein